MSNDLFLTLDNGLTILVYADESKITNYVSLYTFLGGCTSSYYNDKKEEKKIYPGTAHYLEHYVCESNVYGNLIDNLKKKKVLGVNALTNSNETVFYFNTARNLEESLELFLRSIYNPCFDREKVEKAKYAVLNEIRDDKDNFSRKIYKKKIDNIFYNSIHTLGNKTSVKRIGVNYIKDVYDNFYVPKNQLLVIAGNFDREKIIGLVKDIYSEFDFKYNKKSIPVKEKREVVRKEDSIKGNSLDEVIISYKIDTSMMSSFEKYKFDWYLSYFVDIMFSRFSKINEIINSDRDFTGDINSCTYCFNGYTVLEVLAYTKSKKKFFDLVSSAIYNYRDSNRDDFELKRKYSKTRVSVRKDNIGSYINPIVDNYIDFDYPYDDTLEFIDSLNYDEYIDTISKIDFSNYSILCVKKES